MKLARLRGSRNRMRNATKGSRINAVITAMSRVMKNTRPKYRRATTTPKAITDPAKLGPAFQALTGLMTGFVKVATPYQDPLTRIYHARVYNEIDSALVPFS